MFARGALALAGAALCGLPSCGMTAEDYDLHDDDEHTEGLSVDTEIASYPVAIKGYVDSYVAKMSSGGTLLIDDVIEQYCKLEGREQVTIEVAYRSADEIAALASGGCDGGFVIGQSDVIEAAAKAETLYGGIATTSVRSLGALNQTKLVIACASGSKAKLPKADTLDGKDLVDTTSGVEKTQLMQLARFEGTIAIADESTLQGAAANQALYRAGLYSEESGVGGSYDASIQKKIAVYKSAGAACESVAAEKRTICFAFNWDASASGLKTIYKPRGFAGLFYSGASVPGFEESGVARDFLQYFALHL